MHVQNYRKYFVKKVCPAIRLPQIMLKQFYSFTIIDTFSCLGCPVVKHQNVMRKFPGSISGADKDFMLALLFCDLTWFC